MAKTKRGLSGDERAERCARDRERLRQAARERLTSDGWQRWVRARALFHNYSLRNCLLLAAQCHERGIDARRVVGFRTWLKLGRCVRKGEKGLVVLAPMPIKRREDGEERDEARVVFRSAFVFADSQTDPLPGVDPAPIEPPCEPLSGDSHRHLLERLQAFAREIDFEVALEPISGSAGGWCDPKRRRIVVDAGLPANAQVRVLVPWRKGRIPTFGMLSRDRCRVVVRAGRSEARRASGDPPERCRSAAGGGGEAGVARPVAGGGAAPVVGGVVAVAEQFAEDGGGDACGGREPRRCATCVGADAELAQGGSIGEVSGAKAACALQLAARDARGGQAISAVLLLETGGVRLQEATLGLNAVAEVLSAMLELRGLRPVVGVAAGPLGSFGGMSIAAGLCTRMVLTHEGRLGLNGPEVIESEAGVAEFDSSDRALVWSVDGGAQRYATGLADALVLDDVSAMRAAVVTAVAAGLPEQHRSEELDVLGDLLARDDIASLEPVDLRDGGRERFSVGDLGIAPAPSPGAGALTASELGSKQHRGAVS